jgi:hypothetical protein
MQHPGLVNFNVHVNTVSALYFVLGDYVATVQA